MSGEPPLRRVRQRGVPMNDRLMKMGKMKHSISSERDVVR